MVGAAPQTLFDREQRAGPGRATVGNGPLDRELEDLTALMRKRDEVSRLVAQVQPRLVEAMTAARALEEQTGSTPNITSPRKQRHP